MRLSPARERLLERLRGNGTGGPPAPAAESSRGPAPGWAPVWAPDPASRYAPFPLTDIQHAYWLGRSADLALGSVASHGYQEVVFRDLDVDRYEAAWNRLIRRHDMLRAVVRPDGLQQILPEVPHFPVPRDDFRMLSAEAAEAALQAAREVMSHRTYDPARWPAYEVRVALMPDGTTVIRVSADALFGDVYSAVVIRGELERLYDDPAAELPPLGVTFRDYVTWLKAQEEGPACAAARDHWAARVATMPPAPALPTLRPPSGGGAPRFARRETRLAPEDWRRLRAAAAKAGATPSVVVLAAFADLLRRWSGSDRFTVNVTLFNRAPIHPDIGGIVGDFTETLLFVCDLEPDEDFAATVARLQRDFAADLDHRAYGGVKVLRDYVRTRATEGAAALMPIVFTSGLGAGDLAGRTGDAARRFGEPGFEITQTPQVLIDHQVLEDGGALVVRWDHVRDAFPPGLIEDMFATYAAVLHDLARVPASWMRRGLAQAPAAQLAARDVVNATTEPRPPRALHAAFATRALETPAAVAVVAGDRLCGYGELLGRARAVARALGEGAGPDETRVGVSMPAGIEQVAAVLGASMAGLAYVPIDPAWPPARRDQVARAAGLRRVLVAANDAAGGPLPGGCAAVPVAVPEATPALPDPSDAAGPDPDPRTPAYVIFTSGSTGQPKGVVVTHAAAWNTIADVTARFGIGPDDRLLGLSPLAFDLSVYDVFGVLGAGATLVLPEPERRRDVGHWIELMVRHRVTVWNSVPALLDLVLRAGHAGYAAAAGLRTVLLSGDWIPLDLVRRFRAIAPQAALHGLGGATEAAIWSIAHPILGAEEGWTSVPYGLPLANQRWHVLDARLDPCPDWVAGDLHIAGDGLALGYLDDPQRTAAAFFRHPRTGERLYHTGDRGRYRPGGVIEFLGRRDGQVKIGGQRIELGEIEAVLEQHPAVRRAVVVAAGEGSARRPVAYVVPERAADAGRLAPETPAQETLAQEILAHVEARLPRVMVPAAVIPIAAVPLTRNGKVDRAALPAPDCTAESHVAPATALERSLAALVAAELKVERVGVTTRLAELGVTSIHLVALHQAIGRELETAVPLAALLGAATVRDLAAAIAAGGDAAAPVAATADGALAARRQARRHAAERRPPGARVD